MLSTMVVMEVAGIFVAGLVGVRCCRRPRGWATRHWAGGRQWWWCLLALTTMVEAAVDVLLLSSTTLRLSWALVKGVHGGTYLIATTKFIIVVALVVGDCGWEAEW